MPRLVQPDSLQDMSMNVLVGFLTYHCDQLNSDDCLDSLRQVVAFIKNEICPSIPWNLAVKFYKDFFDEYEDLNWLRMLEGPDTDRRAVVEIIMDRKIRGLRWESDIMASLDSNDVHRLHGLTLLDLSTHYPLRRKLEDFHLEDLTTFIFRSECTDTNLQVIGQNCPKLVFLDTTNSRAVTDQGLSYLNLCSELRSVYIAGSRVTYAGLAKFLSAHPKIAKLRAWCNSQDYGFDCFSNYDPTVYPSINSFTIVSNRVVHDHLRSVVVKFPNLTLLGISGDLTGDLNILTPLNGLSELDFCNASEFSWDNLKQFLVIRGENITVLRMPSAPAYTPCITQNDLNFMFQYCKNIEHLEINYRANFTGEKLVVASFQKLNHFSCGIPSGYRRRNATIEFEELLKLESLLINRFHFTEEDIKSMILDNDKFPVLNLLKISRISGCINAIDNITQFAESHNLDIKIMEI